MLLPFDFDRIPVDLTRVKLFDFHKKKIEGLNPITIFGPSIYQTIFVLQRIDSDAGNTSIQQNLAPGYFSFHRWDKSSSSCDSLRRLLTDCHGKY
jgi:hypothetical protein